VEALELRRADIGFGRVIVDAHGVTRSGLWTTASLAWHEILDYRLTVDLRDSPAAVFSGMGDLAEPLGAALVIFDRQSGRPSRFGIDLVGETRRIRVNWRFHDAELAIRQILAQLRHPLGSRERDAFAVDGVGRFGALAIADLEVRWRGKPALPRAEVEAIAVFNSWPLSLRVVARDRVLPYASAKLARIPNLIAALDLARALGYRVRGRELLARLGV